MRQNIVLIDFENLQPVSLAALAPDHFRVLVFVGANQTRIPFETAASLQQLGSRAEYVKIDGNGRNAVDFHIAFYIGQLAASDPKACFLIVSNDTGFDPLVSHLNARKIHASRVTEIDGVPVIRASSKKTPAERVEIVVEKLTKPKATKPRTVKTLSSAVSSYFRKQLSDEEIAAVISGLVKSGFISVEGNKVSYAAPGPNT